jgi:putative hemolysin
MVITLVFVVLIALLVISAYVSRLFTESGKFLSREFQENIEIFEHQIEPRLGFSHRRAALSFALLEHLLTAAICFLLAYSVFSQSRWRAEEAVQAVFLVVLVIVLFGRFLPFLLFSRTRGGWLLRFVLLLRLLVYVVLPLTLVLAFLQSVVSLTRTESADEEPEHPSEAVDALIEAGQDEGILEESDRELIHSVVEFGDKSVRDVMQPRPSIFAVSAETTVEQLTQLLSQHPYSRVPVYQGELDNIVGIVSARDLLQVADADASRRLVSSLMKTDVFFVPETKRASELLNEMQRENRRMAVVIDEYGGVAGLVTVEDLVEEIVGELSNEGERTELLRESEHSYIVPGGFETGRLEELFDIHLSEEWHATTVGGLITEIAGRIPLPGESVQEGGLAFEVLASTARRVEKVRVLTKAPSAPAASADAGSPPSSAAAQGSSSPPASAPKPGSSKSAPSTPAIHVAAKPAPQKPVQKSGPVE